MSRAVVLFVTALCLLSSGEPSVGADQTFTVPHQPLLIIPAGSPLRYKSVSPYGDVEFEGKVVVKGTYYFGRSRANSRRDFELTFVPSREVYAVLPYFKGYRHLEEIEIANPDDFINAVIPPGKLVELRKKRWGFISGKIDIWIDRFTARVECDAPIDQMRFLSVYKAEPVRIAQSMDVEGC